MKSINCDVNLISIVIQSVSIENTHVKDIINVTSKNIKNTANNLNRMQSNNNNTNSTTFLSPSSLSIDINSKMKMMKTMKHIEKKFLVK